MLLLLRLLLILLPFYMFDEPAADTRCRHAARLILCALLPLAATLITPPLFFLSCFLFFCFSADMPDAAAAFAICRYAMMLLLY